MADFSSTSRELTMREKIIDLARTQIGLRMIYPNAQRLTAYITNFVVNLGLVGAGASLFASQLDSSFSAKAFMLVSTASSLFLGGVWGTVALDSRYDNKLRGVVVARNIIIAIGPLAAAAGLWRHPTMSGIDELNYSTLNQYACTHFPDNKPNSILLENGRQGTISYIKEKGTGGAYQITPEDGKQFTVKPGLTEATFSITVDRPLSTWTRKPVDGPKVTATRTITLSCG